MQRALIACLVACTSVAGCNTTPAPPAYPVFAFDDAKPLVVVADARPGDILPQLEDCKRKEVVCMDLPMWLKVSVRETLYGNAPSKRMAVSTINHSGFYSYERIHAPRLMVLMVGPNGDVVMPEYFDYPIVRRNDGAWFLPIDDTAPIEFLPCATTALKEPIDPKQFPASLASEDGADWTGKHPEIFQTIGGKAYPRYGIAIARIRDELQRTQPRASELQCEESDA